jgi:hypothetical protein
MHPLKLRPCSENEAEPPKSSENPLRRVLLSTIYGAVESMSNEWQRADELALAMDALDGAGIEFFGPFSSLKNGEHFVIADRIVTLTEVLELISKGQLNRDGVRNLLSSQSNQ